MKLLLTLHTSEGYQSKQEHLCALIILTEHTNPNLVRRSPSISLCGTWRWFPGLLKQPCCSLCCRGDSWQTTWLAVLAPAALLFNSRGGGSVGVFWRLSEGFPLQVFCAYCLAEWCVNVSEWKEQICSRKIFEGLHDGTEKT